MVARLHNGPQWSLSMCITLLYDPLPQWIGLTFETSRILQKWLMASGLWGSVIKGITVSGLLSWSHEDLKQSMERPTWKGAGVSHQSAPTCQHMTATWEVDPPVPVKPSDDCTMINILSITSWKTLSQNHQEFSHFWIPDTQKLWEIMFIVFKLLNLKQFEEAIDN